MKKLCEVEVFCQAYLGCHSFESKPYDEESRTHSSMVQTFARPVRH